MLIIAHRCVALVFACVVLCCVCINRISRGREKRPRWHPRKMSSASTVCSGLWVASRCPRARGIIQTFSYNADVFTKSSDHISKVITKEAYYDTVSSDIDVASINSRRSMVFALTDHVLMIDRSHCRSCAMPFGVCCGESRIVPQKLSKPWHLLTVDVVDVDLLCGLLGHWPQEATAGHGRKCDILLFVFLTAVPKSSRSASYI